MVERIVDMRVIQMIPARRIGQGSGDAGKHDRPAVGAGRLDQRAARGQPGLDLLELDPVAERGLDPFVEAFRGQG